MRRFLVIDERKVVLRKVISWFGKDKTRPAPTKTKKRKPTPTVEAPQNLSGATTISRQEHPVSRKQLSPNALKVLYRLKDQGYHAYLVGGCIRDILLGLEPKDFDVVTNATPEQVKACFNNCRLIGRRFRLAHVMFGREIIEVATFRGHHDDNAKANDQNEKKVSKQSDEGQLLRDNVYGTIEEDAERRDFTINALYYSINDYAIYDFANGMRDINKGLIDLIGDPETRYREDPVRMLRAVRFATKLNMQIAERTEAPIFELNHLLSNIPPARLFDESLKLFLAGKAADNFQALKEYGLFKYFFPAVSEVLTGNREDKEEILLQRMFENTDQRINAGKSVSPAFILAALFWYPLEGHANELAAESGLHPYDAFQMAINDVLHRAVQRVAIPRRFSTTMREIWQFQHRLTKTKGKRAEQLLDNPRFRAAYDFLLLRAEAEGGELVNLAQIWTDYQAAPERAGQTLNKDVKKPRKNSGKKYRGRRRRKPDGQNGPSQGE
jgi:poly(A) polymerase